MTKQEDEEAAIRASKQQYVVGFAFTKGLKDVALILKNKPANLEGKLNGIGGKIEAGEKPLEAMIREFNEEAGVLTKPSDWNYIALWESDNHIIHVFTSNTITLSHLRTMTSEEIVIANTKTALYRTIPVYCTIIPKYIRAEVTGNAKWIIPFAVSWYSEKKFARVVYPGST